MTRQPRDLCYQAHASRGRVVAGKPPCGVALQPVLRSLDAVAKGEQHAVGSVNGITSRNSHARPAQRLPGLAGAVTVLLALGVTGCSGHRISLAKFLTMQKAAEAVQRERVKTDTTFNADEYLGPYKLGPGDVVTVLLTGTDGTPLFPPLPARVDRHGRIDLPVVGPVNVGNSPLSDAEDIILSAYVPNVYKAASCHVQLTNWETTEVLVLGAVTQPGLVELRRTERNMLFAIVSAGGVSTSASGYVTLRRLRKPAEEITLNLRDPLDINAALALEPLATGDIVTVHAAVPHTIYVGGLVNRPGRQDYAPETQVTVLQALAGANGLRTDVFPSEGTLIRRMPDGKDAFVKLNLNRLATGADPNFLLEPGDILWVPETIGTRIQAFLNQNLFLRAGATVTYNLVGFDTFSNNGSGFGTGGGFGGGGTLQNTIDPLGFLGTSGATAGSVPSPKRRR